MPRRKLILRKNSQENRVDPKKSVEAVIKHFVVLAQDKELLGEKLRNSESKLEGESLSAFIERQRKESPDAIIGTNNRARLNMILLQFLRSIA